MKKRGRKKKSNKSKVGEKQEKQKSLSATEKYETTIRLLIENSIALQKKLIELVEAINETNSKLNNVLDLIENASKEIVKKEKERAKTKREGESELANKLDELIKQNKIIARGLILLEKYVKEKIDKVGEEKSESGFKPLPEFKF